jgi:integrase
MLSVISLLASPFGFALSMAVLMLTDRFLTNPISQIATTSTSLIGQAVPLNMQSLTNAASAVYDFWGFCGNVSLPFRLAIGKNFSASDWCPSDPSATSFPCFGGAMNNNCMCGWETFFPDDNSWHLKSRAAILLIPLIFFFGWSLAVSLAPFLWDVARVMLRTLWFDWRTWEVTKLRIASLPRFRKLSATFFRDVVYPLSGPFFNEPTPEEMTTKSRFAPSFKTPDISHSEDLRETLIRTESFIEQYTKQADLDGKNAEITDRKGLALLASIVLNGDEGKLAQIRVGTGSNKAILTVVPFNTTFATRFAAMHIGKDELLTETITARDQAAAFDGDLGQDEALVREAQRDEKLSRRPIEPYGIAFYSRAWAVAGYTKGLVTFAFIVDKYGEHAQNASLVYLTLLSKLRTVAPLDKRHLICERSLQRRGKHSADSMWALPECAIEYDPFDPSERIGQGAVTSTTTNIFHIAASGSGGNADNEQSVRQQQQHHNESPAMSQLLSVVARLVDTFEVNSSEARTPQQQQQHDIAMELRRLTAKNTTTLSEAPPSPRAASVPRDAPQQTGRKRSNSGATFEELKKVGLPADAAEKLMELQKQQEPRTVAAAAGSGRGKAKSIGGAPVFLRPGVAIETNGLKDVCTLTTLVAVLHNIAISFDQSCFLPGEQLAHFADLNTAREYGVAFLIWFLRIDHDKVEEGLNLDEELDVVLDGLCVGGVPLRSCVCLGDDWPSRQVRRLVTAAFSKPLPPSKFGHWSFGAHCQPYAAPESVFYGDTGSVLDHMPGDQRICFWRPMSASATRRYGKGPSRACKGCGKEHTDASDSKRCTGCGGNFIGACAEPDAGTDLNFLLLGAGETPPYLCQTCRVLPEEPPERALEEFEKELKAVVDVTTAKLGPAPKYFTELTTHSDGSPINAIEAHDKRLDADQDPTARAAQLSGRAQITGEQLRRVTIFQSINDSAASAMAVNGLAETTRAFHLVELLAFFAFMKRFQSLLALPVAIIAIAYLRWISADPKKGGWWLPQTLLRRALNLIGALAALPIYSNANHSVAINFNAEFRAMLKRLGNLAAEAQPTRQRAATFEDITKALQLEQDINVKIAIILQWFLAARVGDIIGLTKKNLSLQGTHLDVTITEGKAVKIRGQHYSVHTALPTDLADLLRRHMATLSADQLVVGTTDTLKTSAAKTTAINTALKRARAGITTRTIRRGALQAMAMGTAELPPVSLETLMSFAGHTREATTKRYLDWGRLFGATAVKERAAAAALAAVPNRA